MNVRRKSKTDEGVRLGTRLLLVSNEMPRLKDPSGAILGRFAVVQLKKSFLGKEDITLPARVAKELPGILNWALDGLERLNKQGRFTVAATHEEAIDIMQDMTTSVRMFIDSMDTIEITGDIGHYVLFTTINQAYKNWMGLEGMDPLSRPGFKKELKAAYPELIIKSTEPAPGVKKNEFILGMKYTGAA